MIGSIRLDRVVLINDDTAERGGAAVIALTSARLLNARRIPVTILSGSADVDPELKTLGTDVEVLGGRHILEVSLAAAGGRDLFAPTPQARLADRNSANSKHGPVCLLHNLH